ncbi:uncharacterized protein A1O5_11934 [Cladophialophora psammophila CBS 110553]|uniref:feruloyl esterase n=1 Tax=Cladophialophora psammophila CBS 110553 TaxID=1182543 RepID=W9WA35_9EURO|nr:uncharacterized protein A1O5_11934 [Cladophialophora psammophila CBS 110553]EXJ61376.1 hypothetical protein A1O5_11934 [Cladophialophora psammophila CBS 110553]
MFVSDLLNYMRDNYCVDNFRIYATGKSSGGGLVDELACSPGHGGDFTAFAMGAAVIYTEADGSGCTPARSPMPILELHGTNDSTANYNGDTSHGAPLPSIRSVFRTWATRNGYGPSPVPVIDQLQSNKAYYTQYDCGAKVSVVVGYNVTGQGHDWISTQYKADNQGEHCAN